MATTYSKFKKANTTANVEKINVYDMITELIISKLEAGVNPWRKTWKDTGFRKGESNGPKNYITGKVYSGINYFLLSMTPFESPYFLTFNQVSAKKGSVKAGAKGMPVVYYNFIEKETKDETTGEVKKQKMGFLKYYKVFNIEQTTLEVPVKPVVETPVVEPQLHVTKLDSVYNNYPNRPKMVQENLSSCYYAPGRDIVNMPKIKQFGQVEEYYSTLYHELIHSTGHSSRLNRDGIVEFDKFGSDKYSKEELIAEMGAAFLCTHMNIENVTLDNSASYLNSWVSKLKGENSKFIFQASSAAKKAVDYILNLKEVEETE